MIIWNRSTYIQSTIQTLPKGIEMSANLKSSTANWRAFFFITELFICGSACLISAFWPLRPKCIIEFPGWPNNPYAFAQFHCILPYASLFASDTSSRTIVKNFQYCKHHSGAEFAVRLVLAPITCSGHDVPGTTIKFPGNDPRISKNRWHTFPDFILKFYKIRVFITNKRKLYKSVKDIWK